MKKNVLLSMMALFVMLFASCSQEEIVSTSTGNSQAGTLVTVSVNVPQTGVASRAMPVVEGHARRCIMQLVSTDGTAIENQRYVEAVTSETVSFTFTAPSEAYQCVFWADYLENADADVKTAKDYIYDTSALPDVGYTGLSHTVHFSDAADAFCGVLANPASGASLTLKRPLTQIAIGTTTPSDYEGYTQVRVGNVGIPGGYNIFTQTVNTTTAKTTRLDMTAMEDAAAGQWTKLFVFASVDQTAYTFPEEYPLSVTISNGNADENKTQTLTSVNVDDNMISNINFTESGGEEPGGSEEDDMTINVSFDDEFDKPADPNALAVGDYINAAGEKVTSASDAVAVVFALADGVTDNSEYGAGKVAEAYAVSLTLATASRTYATNYYSMNLAETATGSYAGYAFTQAIDAARQEGTDYRQLDNFFNSNQAPALSGDNVSGWYIPSLAQLQAVANVDNETLTATLQGGYTGDYSLATSSVVISNEEHCLQGVIVTQATGVLGNNNTIQESTSFHILPVVTIFE